VRDAKELGDVGHSPERHPVASEQDISQLREPVAIPDEVRRRLAVLPSPVSGEDARFEEPVDAPEAELAR
jgi:hypothetical protein